MSHVMELHNFHRNHMLIAIVPTVTKCHCALLSTQASRILHSLLPSGSAHHVHLSVRHTSTSAVLSI